MPEDDTSRIEVVLGPQVRCSVVLKLVGEPVATPAPLWEFGRLLEAGGEPLPEVLVLVGR